MSAGAPGAGRLDARLVVTGTRLPMTQDLLAADVVVIERADIEASTADSLADLLRTAAPMLRHALKALASASLVGASRAAQLARPCKVSATSSSRPLGAAGPQWRRPPEARAP